MTQQIIKLSKETLEILKISASINNSIKFKPGNEVKTISASGSVIMEAEIVETFPIEFSIYELNKFLSVLNLPNMKDAELVFEDDKKVTIKADKSKIQYYFTDQQFAVHPNKTVKLPSVDLSIELTAETLESFSRAAAALGHKIMEFRVVSEKAFLVATTPQVDTSNDYIVELADVPGTADGSYKLKLENLKIMGGDYDVEICSKGIMKMVNKNRKLDFYIGLERTV